MLQIHWYLRVGSDVHHFYKVWKNVKISLEKEQNRYSKNDTPKELPKTAQIAPKMLPRALPRGPEAAPRAPKCSPRSLQQPTRSYNITSEASKVGPRGLRGTSRTPSGPQNGGPGGACVPSKGRPGIHLDLKMETWGGLLRTKEKP